MKDFIKQNLVLVVGFTLPLLLVLVFLAATVIPKAFSTPPQYEMLFSTIRYDYQNPSEYTLDFAVKEHKLMVKAQKNDRKDRAYNTKSLMAYDGKTETVRQISIDPAQFSGAAEGSSAILAETASMTIDAASMSPDGYVLEGPGYCCGGMVAGMFGGYGNGGFRLKKGSVGYKIPDMQGNHYYNQLQFIGWVIKQ